LFRCLTAVCDSKSCSKSHLCPECAPKQAMNVHWKNRSRRAREMLEQKFQAAFVSIFRIFGQN
jgi:hypothetical protein